MEKRKQNKTGSVRPKLVAIMNRWNLPMVTVAEEMSMQQQTFRTKLNPNYSLYGFSDDEYLEVIEVLTRMADDLKKFVKNHDISLAPGKKLSKSKIIIPKNEIPPFILERQF